MCGRWRAGLAALVLITVLIMSVACGGGAETATPESPVSTTPSLSPTPVPEEPNPEATPPAPTVTPLPTPVPSPTAPATPAPTPLPQTAALKLEVASPAEDTVVRLSSITGGGFPVAGLTSPDATVSVNGILATPDHQGRFSAELPLTEQDNPLPIEVIATSINGEQRSLIRTVIFLP